MQNLIIYDGPSVIDGAPIVAILTGLANASRNAGTGDMLQTDLDYESVRDYEEST